MSNASKPPEETPTPSTDSLPSYMEWCEFYKKHLPVLYEHPRLGAREAALLMSPGMAKLTQEFLAQRGSRP